MDGQATATIYEPPILVELGEFGEDTLGGPGDEFEGDGFFEPS
ncbi:MAG: lasso RiPP family leader peptide-containing protein [Pseudonocardiaceae bacterium]